MRLYINTEEFIVPKMMIEVIPKVISGLRSVGKPKPCAWNEGLERINITKTFLGCQLSYEHTCTLQQTATVREDRVESNCTNQAGEIRGTAEQARRSHSGQPHTPCTNYAMKYNMANKLIQIK